MIADIGKKRLFPPRVAIMTNVSLPANKLWMIASWLSLKESKPKWSCKCDNRVLDGCPFFLVALLLTAALVFLVEVFFVSVVAILQEFSFSQRSAKLQKIAP